MQFFAERDANRECWVYRLYCTKSQDRDGTLLYVGISDSPSSRMGQHESQKWWWWLVDKIEWERLSNRKEAESFESRAIQTESPMFNKAQSQFCDWERLRDIVYLLWAHDLNTWMHPVCPFCASDGHEEILSPDGPCELFLRNSDDKLIIHFAVSCDRHVPHGVQWATHIKVETFLIGFGNAPQNECDSLLDRAFRSGKIPWEDRLGRINTLGEALDASSLHLIKNMICKRWPSVDATNVEDLASVVSTALLQAK